MIGYVTLGTKDLKKAAAFYDKIAAEMGIGRFMESDTFIAWGSAGGGAGLGLTQPFDGKPTKALPARAVRADFTRPISGIRKATSSTPS
jgi:catechol 2,3-dioxygenase-like lactoylglutathione lyase family enzyme